MEPLIASWVSYYSSSALSICILMYALLFLSPPPLPKICVLMSHLNIVVGCLQGYWGIGTSVCYSRGALMLVADVFGCPGWHDCLSTDPHHEQHNNDREAEYPQKRTLQEIPQARGQGKPRCCSTRHFSLSITAGGIFLKEQMGQQVQPRYIY